MLNNKHSILIRQGHRVPAPDPEVLQGLDNDGAGLACLLVRDLQLAQSVRVSLRHAANAKSQEIRAAHDFVSSDLPARDVEQVQWPERCTPQLVAARYEVRQSGDVRTLQPR